MEAYQALLARGGPATPPSAQGKPGRIGALITDYYKSDAFKVALAHDTQRMRRNILEHFREEHGDKRAALLQTRHINKLLEGKKHHAKKNWLKTIKGLMAFAVTEGIRRDNPCDDVELVKAAKSMGHMTWLEPQIEQYRKRHALGTTARLAIELLLNIAARRYDAHVIGAQNIQVSNKDGRKKLCWRPHKTLRTTNKMLKIPVLPSFQAAMDAMPKDQDRDALAFLRNDYGRPFASAAAFGNKFADWCTDAGLKAVLCDDGRVRNYRAHGLRKAALRMLAHAGCTGVELLHVSGHSSLKQLQEYLDEVDQELMAASAMDKLVAAEAKTATAGD
jgi:hypothetical protein